MEKEFKFPNYCCFGKLQSDSICETADEITADYMIFGSIVHKLIYSKKDSYWQIQDFAIDGSKLRLSGGKTQDNTICIHMLFIDDKTDQLIGLVRNELFKLGNIWLNSLPAKGDGTHITYSPAGLLMTVRLLLSERGDIKGNLDKLKELPVEIGSDVCIKLEMLDSYETYCIINRHDDKTILLKTFIAEFIVPLAFIYDAAKWLVDNCKLQGNRIDRIIIESSRPEEIKIQGFQFVTPDSSGETGFIAIMKGIMKSKEEFANKLKAIREKYGS